jgi:phospho-N-acetylmuramoyl-pentapeptide-transferase
MFYWLHTLTDQFSPLRIFQYITFRSLGASGTAFLLTLLLGPFAIRTLRRFKLGQQIRRDEATPLYQFHGKKAGTPTMGGVMILVAVAVSTLLWARPGNVFVLLTLATMVFMGLVGAWDDVIKITRRRSLGLCVRSKLALQIAWAAAAVVFMWNHDELRTVAETLMVPFLKDPVMARMSLAGAFLFLTAVLVGASNAVNLTDGLDGLAIGCSNTVAFAYLIMAYVAGHAVFAGYLQVPHIPGAGELTVFCGALLGAGLGFLWFNCHPAKVFMGDTGSLALGGGIAMVAILIEQELVLAIVGGVFVLEALSVLIQVAYFKWSGGQRVFRCAPLHHHFEYLEKDRAEREGRDVEVVETMITIRFWIVSIVAALIGLATLKIR